MAVEHCFASYLTCDTLVTLPCAYVERLLVALAPKISRGEKRAGDSDSIKIQLKYSIKNTVVFELGQDVGGSGNKK